MPINDTLQSLSKRLDTTLKVFFYNLGLKVAHNPWKVILLALLLVLSCLSGLLNFEVENNPDKLYTPSNARSHDERTYVEDTWGYEDRRANVYAHALPEGSSALTAASLLAFLDIVEDLEAHTVVYDGETLTYDGLCSKIGTTCARQSILDLFDYNRTVIADLSPADIVAAVNQPSLTDVIGRQLNIAAYLGGISRDGSGAIVSAEALALSFQLENFPTSKGGALDDWSAQTWEKALKEVLYDAPNSDLKVYLMTQGGTDSVENAAITADAELLPLGYILMLGYTIMVLSRKNRIHSQSSLAFATVLCIMLATLAGFSLVAAFIKFSLVVQAAVFLLLGIGIDDTFVIINAFRLTDTKAPNEERVAMGLSHAGAAITVTSLTDFSAFVAGSFSTIPAIQVFCLYSAVGVLFDFLFQVTLFIAFLTLDLRRQNNNRVDVFWCCTSSDRETDCLTGAPFDHESRGAITEAISRGVARAVLSNVGRVVTLVVAVGLLAAGCYGASQLEKEFERERFVPTDGNYIRATINFRNKYFSEVDQLVTLGIYTQSGDYFEAMDDLRTLSDNIPNIDFDLENSTVNWFTAFESYLETAHPSNPPTNNTEFVTLLQEFLGTESGSVYNGFVKFDQSNTGIEASRITLLVGFETSKQMIRTMDTSRAITDHIRSITVFPYTFAFIFMDGLKVLDTELAQNLMLAGAAVLLICTLLLANIGLGLLIGLMLIFIDIEMLGWAYYFDYTLDPVTLINSLIAVGIAVDYNVHLAHGFMSSHKVSKVERAKDALIIMGGPVMSGALSTFLAVLPLVISASYVFEVFFNLLAGLILFALFHGVCVLPVLLSLIGPDPHPEEAGSQHGEFSVKSPRRPEGDIEMK